MKYIILGCPNQFRAIGDSFNGIACEADIEASNWLKTMCDGNRVHLTESMRSGEGVLWDFYSSVAVGGARHDWPLREQLELARQLFPKRGEDTQWNRTVSHKTRIAINRSMNDRERLKHPDAMFLDTPRRRAPTCHKTCGSTTA